MNELMYLLMHGWRVTADVKSWDDGVVEVRVEHRRPVSMWVEVGGLV